MSDERDRLLVALSRISGSIDSWEARAEASHSSSAWVTGEECKRLLRLLHECTTLIEEMGSWASF